MIWYENASDALLERLYREASAAILPSEGEGFGLPLVEAAHAGLPVIARNLDVFKEIGGEGAYYFDAEHGEDLGQAILNWIELYKSDAHPLPAKIFRSTWNGSTEDLLKACGLSS